MCADVPCTELLTPEVVTFLHGGVVSMVGSASIDLAPALTRGYAPRVAPDRATVDVFVGRRQATRVLANLGAGASIAVIIGNPNDYRGLQMKGTVVEQREVGAGDADWLKRYRQLLEETLAILAFSPGHVARFWSDDLRCITFAPAALFRQTPGPGAGAPLAAGPPWK